jgi:hypothetical protein
MPESLQELIAQWRKEARDIHELGRDNQDLIRCADDLEAALAAVAPGEAEKEPERSVQRGQPLTVIVADGKLIVEIGIHTLAHAVSFADWANPYDEPSGDYIRAFAILDPEEFAKDVTRAMQSEAEDGSTQLTDFIDEMAETAMAHGSTATDEARVTHGHFDPRETWAGKE